MAEFHLLRPWALALLLLLPPIYLLLKKQRKQGQYWSNVIPAHLRQAMLAGHDNNTKPAALMWPLSTLLLMILALSGPTWEKQPVPLFQLQQGRVLVMDLSASMWATDLKPNRLTQARYKAQDLLKLLDEGEMGLVAYAGDAFALAPLTSDRSTIANILPALGPEMMPALGSNLPAALTQADQLLRDAGHQSGEIILLADDVLPEYMDEAFALIDKMPWKLQILAFGSSTGAPMKNTEGILLRDLDGSVAFAKTNYDALTKLAQRSGGKMVPYHPSDNDLLALLPQLDPNQPVDETSQQQSMQQWLDRGGYLIPLLLPLLALALRRHGLLALAPLLLLGTPSAEASPWQTDDQRGQQLFEQQQYQQAAETFTDPSWRGSAYYRAGDYQGALDAFNQAEGADALFNQGNALAQLGDTEQALQRYQQALQQQPEHPGALANKALLEQLQQQQQQQQSGDGESDQSQQDDSQQQDSQSEDAQQQDGQQQDQQQSQQNSQQQDQSEQSSEQQQDQNQNSSNANSQQTDQSLDEPQQPPESEPKSNPATGQQSPEEQEQAQQAEQMEAATTDEQPEQSEQDGEQQNAATALGQPSQRTEEQQQQLQQILNQVEDDPTLLLRNKMQLEYQRRRQQGNVQREQTQW